jgi:hypothetical protein
LNTHPLPEATRASSLTSALRLLLGRPRLVPLGRGQCHRLLLETKGIAPRQLASSVGLQLGHLTGQRSLGYAWLSRGERTEVWYWDESAMQAQEGQTPCPEMLLRSALGDGLHLLRCLSGFEAISRVDGQLHKTRWFAQSPDAQAWAAFVQDAGFDPAQHPIQEARVAPLNEHMQRGWRMHSSALRPLTWQYWAAVAGVTLVGCAVFSALTYQVKLNLRLEELRAEHTRLASESAAALTLQRQIDDQRLQLDAVAAVQPAQLQMRLMARLADSNLFDGLQGKVGLSEWEFRNGRIRMAFSVPAEGFSLSDFLQDVEALDLFSDLRLLPGAPAQVVALQAALKSSLPPPSQGSNAP